MKYKLMIQALSPLALLTIIKNFSFIVRDECGKNLDTASFWDLGICCAKQ